MEKGIQIDLSTEPCNRFLVRHVNCKTSVVVLYVDIDGSTKMSLSLPASKVASILQIFSQEMSLNIKDYGGYTLKYVGDAVIALFPAAYNREHACKNALNCAKSMIGIIQECINPEFGAHGLPEIKVKISLDFGEALVVLYGKGIEKSHIDIVGSNISMSAKMLSFVRSNQIIIGQSVYDNLSIDSSLQNEFEKLKVDQSRWSYTDEKNGSQYQLYLLK